jgi:hypothetical protein
LVGEKNYGKKVRTMPVGLFMLGKSEELEPGIGHRELVGTSKAAFGWAERIGYSSKDFTLFGQMLKLKDAFFLNFALLFAYVLIMNREGPYVPSNNEFVYLPYLAKLWDADFLSNDWTFSGPLPSHLVFNLLFGPLSLLFPLEVIGWIGRIFSWSLILTALLRCGRHFRIPLWMVTVAILSWLFYGQSIVGGEWVLGTFEAKSIAYALLFFALDGFVRQRVILPWILLGLAFSFHPLVGLWAMLAIGLSLLILGYSTDAIIKFACYTALFALPGVIPLLLTSFGGGSESAEVWKFITLVVIPYHFDPFYFGGSKLLLLLLGLMLGFNYLHYRLGGKSPVLQFMITFQAFLGFFFILGFLLRFTENYQLLVLMPCRLFPVLLPLFFFFCLMSALCHYSSTKSGKGLILAGFLIVTALGNPVNLLVDRVIRYYDLWTRQEENVKTAFKWIAENTPANSIVISPPWRGDSFYLTRRAQVASWWLPRFDRLAEWRERLELLAGDLSSVREGTTKARMEHMTSHYHQLTATDIASITEKYGAEYLVSSAGYSYPVLFESGIYKVYLLRKDGPSGGEG